MDKPPVAAPDRALTGLRKRQQIEATNKQIFLWVAGAAVLISFCVIALQFLGKEFLFNQKIINEKAATNQQLERNIATAEQLKANVDKLLADENLSSVDRIEEAAESSNLTVVLDALPTTGDSTGFANSLQSVVFPLSKVTIKELSTKSEGVEAEDSASAAEPADLPFSATITGKYDNVRLALNDLSRVIRPINPLEMNIRASDDTLQVTISGVTYYLPAAEVNVSSKVVEP